MHRLMTRRTGVVFASVLMLTVCGLLIVGGCGKSQPVVNKIDHVPLSSTNGQQLFEFFTNIMGLPAAWPYMSYPGYSTGGVQAGNVNIETATFGAPATGATSPTATIYGIVLEPAAALSTVTPILNERGAAPAKAQVQQAPVNGKMQTVWTNVTLGSLSTKGYIVYLCAYEPSYKALLDSHKQTPPLGKVGVESMKQLNITATDVAATRKAWEKALAPNKMSSDGTMTIGTGPAVKIVSGPSNRITAMVLTVKSLEQAKTYFQNNGMLLSSTASELRLDPSKVQGLDIRMVQQ
jgi:hypothetical protein